MGVSIGVNVTESKSGPEFRSELGQCSLSPDDPVVAGAFGTWTLTYTAGSMGIAPGGSIAVVPPCNNGLRWRIGHVTATTNGRCGLAIRTRNDYPLVYHHAQFPVVFVTVELESLRLGEQIQLTLGDPGSLVSGFYERARAQELSMKDAYFEVMVDVRGNASYSNPAYPYKDPMGYRLLPDLPHLDVIAGPPSRAAITAPATVAPGEAFDVLVRVEDEYGNTCPDSQGKLVLGSWSGKLECPPAVQLRRGEDAARVGPFKAGMGSDSPLHITGQAWDLGISGVSNPIDVVNSAAERIFFGDLHTHAPGKFRESREPLRPFAAQGFGTFEEAYSYARDVAGLDFVALAWFPPPADFQDTSSVPRLDDWVDYQTMTRRFHEPNRFVPFAAIELDEASAGHRVVVFPRDDGPAVRIKRIELQDLWPALKGTDAVVIPHHPNTTSEGGPDNWVVQDWGQHNPDYQPVVEICQNRGAFETDEPGGATAIGGFGASVQDALALGHRLGFVGGTDSHHGRPGSNRCPMAGVDFHDHVTGGLTAVIATELTREAILDALWARRCYATTGARIVLRFEVDGHAMGQEFTSASTQVRAAGRVLGTAPISKLEIVCNNEVVFDQRVGNRIALLDHVISLEPSVMSYLYLRVTQEDGQMAWSSPVWASTMRGQPS